MLIVNRFGRQEREGKGLSYLVERALSADIPVVIAVPSHRFADWIKFADGMSVKLRCSREALDALVECRLGPQCGDRGTGTADFLRSAEVRRRFRE